MHTLTIKHPCITDHTCSSSHTEPDNSDPHELMGNIGKCIEQLDVILFQVISCKAKLDEIFRHLSDYREQNQSVSVGVGTKILCVEQYITNTPVMTYLDSVHDTLKGVVFPPL